MKQQACGPTNNASSHLPKALGEVITLVKYVTETPSRSEPRSQTVSLTVQPECASQALTRPPPDRVPGPPALGTGAPPMALSMLCRQYLIDMPICSARSLQGTSCATTRVHSHPRGHYNHGGWVAPWDQPPRLQGMHRHSTTLPDVTLTPGPNSTSVSPSPSLRLAASGQWQC